MGMFMTARALPKRFSCGFVAVSGMSEDDPLVNGQPLSALRVVDLKEELDKRGLSKLGNKGVLAERLREYIFENESPGGVSNTSPSKEKNSSPTKITSPSSENPLVAEYRAKQQAALEEAKKDAERVRCTGSASDESADVSSPSPKRSPQKRQHSVSETQEHEKRPIEEELDEGSDEKASPKVEEPFTTTQEEEVISTDLAGKESHGDDLTKEFTTVMQPSSRQEILDSSSHDSSQSTKITKEEPAIELSEDKKLECTSEEAIQDPDEGSVDEKSSSTSSLVGDSVGLENEVGNQVETKDSAQVSAEDTIITVDENGQDHEELDYGEEEEKETKDEVLEIDDRDTESVRGRDLKRRVEAPESEQKSDEKKLRTVSPSRHPESDVIHVRGLTRPFTVAALKQEFVKCGGEIVDFWIDNVKSHCIVQMRSIEEARAIRIAMHNTNWPTANPKTLSVQFDTKENMDRHRNGGQSTPSVRSEKITSDRSERPTLGAMPGRNASLRVTVEAAMRDNQRMTENKEKRDREKESSKDVEQKPKVEPVPVLKEGEKERKRRRSETPPFSRGAVEKRERRDSEHDRRKDQRDKIQEKKKDKDEEPRKPVKTADSLFKKTVAQPSIYFMPLCEEEANIRQLKREAEEKKKKEKERVREREKEKSRR